MALVRFTQNIQRHVACPPRDAAGNTVREVLDQVFGDNPKARGYFLDDRGAVRPHINIFLDGVPVRDRTTLTDSVDADSEIDVMQALSGG